METRLPVRMADLLKKREYQSVVLTFSDGSTASFTGPAVIDFDADLLVVDVAFTTPKPLDADTIFVPIGEI